jgi:single-strand DNA-binding protein
MATLNQVTLIGYLGADAESRTLGSGKLVANLRLATNRRVKRGDQWEDETEWHRIVVFGDGQAAFAAKLTKGELVSVVGEIQSRKWTDKEGVERISTEIVARLVLGLGGRRGERAEGGGPGPDDDVPF